MENSLQPTQIDTFDVRHAIGTNGTPQIGIELRCETKCQAVFLRQRGISSEFQESLQTSRGNSEKTPLRRSWNKIPLNPSGVVASLFRHQYIYWREVAATRSPRVPFGLRYPAAYREPTPLEIS